jgi:hypothetical protein
MNFLGVTIHGRSVALLPERLKALLALSLETTLLQVEYIRREESICMTVLQVVYYSVMIASVLCGAAFKIGYELGKNSKQADKRNSRTNTKSNCPRAKR